MGLGVWLATETSATVGSAVGWMELVEDGFFVEVPPRRAAIGEIVKSFRS